MRHQSSVISSETIRLSASDLRSAKSKDITECFPYPPLTDD